MAFCQMAQFQDVPPSHHSRQRLDSVPSWDCGAHDSGLVCRSDNDL